MLNPFRSLLDDYRNVSRAMSQAERQHHIATSEPEPPNRNAEGRRTWDMGELTNLDDTTDAVGGW